MDLNFNSECINDISSKNYDLSREKIFTDTVIKGDISFSINEFNYIRGIINYHCIIDEIVYNP
jgi:hypothetical protein